MKRLLLLLALSVFASPAKAAPIQAATQQTLCAQDIAPLDFLAEHHATVMRFGFGHARAGEGLQCVHDAYTAGYKIYLTIVASPYEALLDPASAAAYYEKWIPIYQAAAPLWAISVENEPELYGYTPAQYRAVWDAVEPVIARLAPDAIPVFAEATPWGEDFIKQAWTAESHPPIGVGAIGYHAYGVRLAGLQDLPELSAWAAQQGVPLWASETTDWLDPPDDLARALSASPNVALVDYYYWPKPPDPPVYLTPTPLPAVVNTQPIPANVAGHIATGIDAIAKPILTQAPARVTRSRTATFRYCDTLPGVYYQVRISGGRWRSAKTRVHFSKLAHRGWIFYVRAIKAGLYSKPTTYGWRVRG